MKYNEVGPKKAFSSEFSTIYLPPYFSLISLEVLTSKAALQAAIVINCLFVSMDEG